MSDGAAPSVQIAALVLAAGGSRRLGEAKQLLCDATGETLIVRIVRALHAAEFDPIVVVTGADADRVAAAVTGLPVYLVHHAGWADGMGTTIAHGMAWLATEVPTAAGVVIAACDMPSVTVSHLRALRAASDAASARVASAYAATHGIPALFPRRDWPTLQALSGDTGARGLLRLADTRSVSLAGGTFDLDTPADVAAWRAVLQQQSGDCHRR